MFLAQLPYPENTARNHRVCQRSDDVLAEKTLSSENEFMSRRRFVAGVSACAVGYILLQCSSNQTPDTVLVQQGWILRADDLPAGKFSHA